MIWCVCTVQHARNWVTSELPLGTAISTPVTGDDADAPHLSAGTILPIITTIYMLFHKKTTPFFFLS